MVSGTVRNRKERGRKEIGLCRKRGCTKSMYIVDTGKDTNASEP